VQAARRGQQLYDNLSCEGIPLNGDEGYDSEETTGAKISNFRSKIFNFYDSEEATESDRIEIRERNGELLQQDLAEAYNNTEVLMYLLALLVQRYKC
jgi:hypothetical protein